MRSSLCQRTIRIFVHTCFLKRMHKICSNFSSVAVSQMNDTEILPRISCTRAVVISRLRTSTKTHTCILVKLSSLKSPTLSTCPRDGARERQSHTPDRAVCTVFTTTFYYCKTRALRPTQCYAAASVSAAARLLLQIDRLAPSSVTTLRSAANAGSN